MLGTGKKKKKPEKSKLFWLTFYNHILSLKTSQNQNQKNNDTTKMIDRKHTSEAKNLHHPGRVSWAPVQLCCRYSRWHRAPARPAGQIGVSWSLASLQEPRTTPRTGPIAEGSCKHYKSISNTCRKNSPDWPTPQLPTKWNVVRLGPSATCLSFYSHHHVLPERVLYPCLLPSLALAAVT